MAVHIDLSELQEVRFRVEREVWNEYKLSDGAILRFKIVAAKFFRTDDVDPVSGCPRYIVAFQNVLSVVSTERMKPRKPPSKPLSKLPDEEKEEVEVAEVIREDWNAYIVEDMCLYEVKPVIVRVIKLKGYFDPFGYPCLSCCI